MQPLGFEIASSVREYDQKQSQSKIGQLVTCYYIKVDTRDVFFRASSFIAHEEIRASFRVMKMTRTILENKSGDQYTERQCVTK